MKGSPEISISSFEGIAIVAGVALVYLAIRLLPRLLAGWRAYVSPPEMKQRLETDEPLLFLDVRTAQEFRGDLGHVPGALNVPLSDLKARLAQPAFLAEWRDATVVTVCRSDPRAAFAVRLLRRAGFSKVLVMSGGMSAWVNVGLPVERGAPKPRIREDW